MTPYLRRMMGMIKVENVGSKISISGLHSHLLLKDLLNHWHTSKIGSNILTDVRGSSFAFHKFYAIEILYIFETLLKSERNVFIQRRFLIECIRQLKENTWLSSLEAPVTNRLNLSYLNQLIFRPLDHQMEFFQMYDELTQRMQINGYFLGSAPGTGKTYMSVALLGMMGMKVKIMIVPPNAMDDPWTKSLRRGGLFKKDPTSWFSTDKEPPQTGCEFYVVHYDYLGKFLEFVKNNLKFFQGAGVAIDEASNFNLANQHMSQRSTYLVEMCQLINSPHVLWMDGTPFRAAGTEAIPFIKTVDPLFNRYVEEGFRKIFGRSATRALDILANRIGHILYLVEKTDIVKTEVQYRNWDVKVKDGEKYTLKAIRIEMGEYARDRSIYYRDHGKEMVMRYHSTIQWFKDNCTTVRRYSELDSYIFQAKTLAAARDYRHVRDEMLFCNKYENEVIIPALPADMRKTFKSDKSVYKYVRLKIQGEVLGRIVMGARIQCNRDMVDGLDTITPRLEKGEKKPENMARSDLELINSMEAKTIIFTSYVEVADRAFDRYTKLGMKPLVVYGDTNKDLAGIMAKFKAEPEYNPLIATYMSLSTAVPITEANGILFLNQPDRQRTYDQALSRAWRLDQKYTVRANNFFLDTGGQENISLRSLDIITWSKEQVDLILGHTTIDITSLESYEGSKDELSVEDLDMIAIESIADDPELLEQYLEGRGLFTGTATDEVSQVTEPATENKRKSILSMW